MVKIEVLGPGCANCQRLEANARQAVEMAGVEAEVVHVLDYRDIMARGVLEHARPRHRRPGRQRGSRPVGRRYRGVAEGGVTGRDC